jgi:hypothetical protein
MKTFMGWHGGRPYKNRALSFVRQAAVPARRTIKNHGNFVRSVSPNDIFALTRRC